MYTLLLSVHVVLCLSLIGLVLLQHGKGADMGATFGSGSNTVFGAGGAATVVTRLTTGLAVGFMVTSLLLARFQNSMIVSSGPSNALSGSVMEGEIEKQQAVDAATSVVVPPSAEKSASEPAPAAPNAGAPAAAANPAPAENAAPAASNPESAPKAENSAPEAAAAPATQEKVPAATDSKRED